MMDRVAITGEVIVITKRGKPVAQLGPVLRKPSTLRGFLKDGVRSRTDLTQPIAETWDADRA
jgi:antitoxin (DNA-binding transcriptional repressor) of toxin-antitoxin stability system